MSVEFPKLEGKKLLVVESQDPAFERGLVALITSLTGSSITYSYNVPEDLIKLFLVDGIDACLIHSPSLEGDVDLIIEMQKFRVPVVVLTSVAYRDENASSKNLIENSGIPTIEKSIGMGCYKVALRLLNANINTDE